MAQPCHPACGAVAVPGAKQVSLPQVTWPLLLLQKDEGLCSSLGRAGGWPGSRFRPKGSGAAQGGRAPPAADSTPVAACTPRG